MSSSTDHSGSTDVYADLAAKYGITRDEAKKYLLFTLYGGDTSKLAVQNRPSLADVHAAYHDMARIEGRMLEHGFRK